MKQFIFWQHVSFSISSEFFKKCFTQNISRVKFPTSIKNKMNAQNIFSPDAFLSKMWNIFSLSLNVRPVFRAIMTDFLIFRHIFYAVRREFLRKPKNLWASFFLTHCFVWRASDTILALLWKSNAFFDQKYISPVKMFHVKQFYIFSDSAAKKEMHFFFQNVSRETFWRNPLLNFLSW